MRWSAASCIPNAGLCEIRNRWRRWSVESGWRTVLLELRVDDVMTSWKRERGEMHL